MALHRPAEFNKSHVPAFLDDEEPKRHVCVYPFVRSYEWYLLEDAERRRMLAEHGKMARDYPDVRANTVASFALGDYEWILAFEADELYRIVDLMRHLRGSETRRHVREEVPFYTGALVADRRPGRPAALAGNRSGSAVVRRTGMKIAAGPRGRCSLARGLRRPTADTVATDPAGPDSPSRTGDRAGRARHRCAPAAWSP